MELCYRGQRYEYTPYSLKVNQTKTTIKYRGCSCQKNNSMISLPRNLDSQMVYRGVSIATGKKIKFLGQYCEEKQIVLAPMTV